MYVYKRTKSPTISYNNLKRNAFIITNTHFANIRCTTTGSNANKVSFSIGEVYWWKLLVLVNVSVSLNVYFASYIVFLLNLKRTAAFYLFKIRCLLYCELQLIRLSFIFQVVLCSRAGNAWLVSGVFLVLSRRVNVRARNLFDWAFLLVLLDWDLV